MNRIFLRSVTRAISAAFLALPLLAVEPPNLLPQPQHIVWGAARLPLHGIAVTIDPNAPPEARWAAQLLAELLSGASAERIQVNDSAPGARAIRLFLEEAHDQPLPTVNERPGPTSREAYMLKLTATGGEIRAHSSAGLFYAVQTIRQLLPVSTGARDLPEVEVEDWPALAYRGLMMDTAHGGLPTVAEIKRQLDFLARFKLNQYYFYAETNIELTGYPLLSYGARYSLRDIQDIIAYARDRHIDVVPCLELYGHLHDLLKLEMYNDYGVMPHGGEIHPLNPKMRAVLADWMKQMSTLFPSPWFHAGLDEPWELERATSAAAGGKPPAEVYLEHLKFIASSLAALGKRPMYWADVNSGARIFTKYPELGRQLPADAIAVSWEYEALSDFRPSVQPLVENHVPFMVATGIWHWDDVAPDFRRTFKNMDGLVDEARRSNALGVMHTAWTDDAQSLYREALPAFAYGGAVAWQSGKVAPSFFRDYCGLIYPVAIAPKVAAALEAMSESEQLLNTALGSESIYRMWEDPLTHGNLARYREHRDELHRSRLLAEQAEANLIESQAGQDETGTLDTLLVGARMLAYAGMRSLYAIEIQEFYARFGKQPKAEDAYFYLDTQIASRNHSRVADLMDEVTSLREAYREAWLKEYGPWRLGSALGRWDAEYEYWRNFQSRVRTILAGFHDGDSLPPLDQLRSKP